MQRFTAVHAMRTARLRGIEIRAHPLRLSAIHGETMVRLAIGAYIIRELTPGHVGNGAHRKTDFGPFERS